MSHTDALEATLDALSDEYTVLVEAARTVVQRARFGYETTEAVARLARLLDVIDGKGAE